MLLLMQHVYSLLCVSFYLMHAACIKRLFITFPVGYVYNVHKTQPKTQTSCN